MKTTSVEGDLRYAGEELKAIFELAYAEDVKKGGRRAAHRHMRW